MGSRCHIDKDTPTSQPQPITAENHDRNMADWLRVTLFHISPSHWNHTYVDCTYEFKGQRSAKKLSFWTTADELPRASPTSATASWEQKMSVLGLLTALLTVVTTQAALSDGKSHRIFNFWDTLNALFCTKRRRIHSETDTSLISLSALALYLFTVFILLGVVLYIFVCLKAA